MQLSELLAVGVMCVIIVALATRLQADVDGEMRTSGIDGRRYRVLRFADAQDAADYLASINVMLLRLVHHAVAKFPDNPGCVRLYQKYDPANVAEGSPDGGNTSYSVNKGEKIVLCIRQKGTHEFVDKNVLMYVAIHELAHIMTLEVGHTNLFWDNFRFLLSEAISIGAYVRVDFDKDPEDYCGIQIASSVI